MAGLGFVESRRAVDFNVGEVAFELRARQAGEFGKFHDENAGV